MSELLLVLGLVIVLPLALVAAALRVARGRYRWLVLGAGGLWLLGVAGFALIAADCGGNLLRGFSECTTLPSQHADALVLRAVAVMAGGAALYVFVLFALLLRHLRSRAGRSS